MGTSSRMMAYAAGLSLLFVVLAMLRPIDHDESQYVAAAMLTARGLVPYRDYAYLQAPLQPFVMAPVAVLAGRWTWPMLRVVNALLGAAAIAGVAGAAAAAGAARGMAVAAAALVATCDILLFSIGTARNDALPAACLATGLWLALRPGRGRGVAMLTGMLFAAAAAAKVSYAVPAFAYGLWALVHARAHRPGWVMAGTVPIVALVGWTIALAPSSFVFDVLTFPAAAPGQYYRAIGAAWKLGVAARVFDTLKFLALGPALLALVAVARAGTVRRPGLAAWLVAAGLLAAWLPAPTWRQYLLPVLPPLFVLLAVAWTRRPPGRTMRIAAVFFAVAGLAPSATAIAEGGGMIEAIRQGSAIRAAMDRAEAGEPVATLSPQFLAASGRMPDARFATGPFYFRSSGLLASADERRLHLVSRAAWPDVPLPPAILTGGEGRWTSGDETLDVLLDRRARAAGYRTVPVAGSRFRLWVAR